MAKILDRINIPEDLKKLSVSELPELASEIRSLIVETVAGHGGHLSSSLGAVELAIALHYAFDAPKDKIIWDVGHQAYAHKILTGRKADFHTLRQLGGVSGFLKPSESPFDAVVSGHASTSISSGLGMAAGRDLRGGTNKVVCVIGDGSMTAGISFEGLNQAGHLKKDLIVILNDNEMSISENVGALSSFLSRKITGRFATKIKSEVEGFIKHIPRIGGRLVNVVKKIEDSVITFLTPGMLFEGLGFHYMGPIDGHNVEELIATFEDAKALNCPVLIHTVTKKGKGYAPAEAEPSLFHGVGKFDAKTGYAAKSSTRSFTDVFSSTLMELASTDKRIVAITAAMPEGTGLKKFAARFPDRFFDVGIAEQHAITFAAGLAKEGFIPVTAIYSTFLQRAYDQVFHDVCIEGLPVIIAVDRAGIVGADGPTHHGMFDISFLRHLPNMIVCAPKDESELRDMLFSAVNYGSPTAIRYPRGACLGADMTGAPADISIGKAEVLREGEDLAILALGSMVYPALAASDMLAKEGVKATVVNARFVKPLDSELILSLAKKIGRIMTIEENALQGGFGSAVLELFEENKLQCATKRIGVPDVFVEHGTQEELRGSLGLDAGGIKKQALLFARERKASSEIAEGKTLPFSG